MSAQANWKDSRTDEWHFTIEREVMKETSIRLSYVGNHGANLERGSSSAQEPGRQPEHDHGDAGPGYSAQ